MSPSENAAGAPESSIDDDTTTTSQTAQEIAVPTLLTMRRNAKGDAESSHDASVWFERNGSPRKARSRLVP